MEEKNSLTILNKLVRAIGAEVYYYENNNIKCYCQYIQSMEATDPIENDIYQIIIFHDKRFHHIPRAILEKKIKSFEFPYFSVKLEYSPIVVSIMDTDLQE